MQVGDAIKEGSENQVVEQPGDEQVEALEAVKADGAIVAEAIARQHDDGGDPADSGHIAENRRSARVERCEWVVCAAAGRRGRAARDRRFGSAAPAVEIRAGHLISALAAKKHLSLHTLFDASVFRQGVCFVEGSGVVYRCSGSLPHVRGSRGRFVGAAWAPESCPAVQIRH